MNDDPYEEPHTLADLDRLELSQLIPARLRRRVRTPTPTREDPPPVNRPDYRHRPPANAAAYAALRNLRAPAPPALRLITPPAPPYDWAKENGEGTLG